MDGSSFSLSRVWRKMLFQMRRQEKMMRNDVSRAASTMFLWLTWNTSWEILLLLLASPIFHSEIGSESSQVLPFFSSLHPSPLSSLAPCSSSRKCIRPFPTRHWECQVKSTRWTFLHFFGSFATSAIPRVFTMKGNGQINDRLQRAFQSG